MERHLNWINKLGYSRYDLTLDSFREALELGMMSKVYTHLISWLSHEIQLVGNYESCINPTKDETEIAAFLVELSTFLREIECPYLAENLNFADSSNFKKEEWLLILDFLTGELAADKIRQERLTETQDLVVKMPETDTSRGLRESLQTLSVSKPPPNVTGVQLFSKIDSKVREMMEKNQQMSKEPLFTGTLTEKQWEALEHLKEEMEEDYRCRREVLLKRLDVTVQSFKWGETGKKRNQDIERVYEHHVSSLSKEPSVTIADILAARENILDEEKTSGSSVREGTKSSLNQVIIGAVPDRGGRPEDQQPPPPEVPSWKTTARPSSATGPSGTSNYSSVRGSGSSSVGNMGPRSAQSQNSNRSQSSFENMSSESMSNTSSSGRSFSRSYRNERGRSGPDSGSDSSGKQHTRGSHVSDYDSGINRYASSMSDNGSLNHFAPNRSYVPSDGFPSYTENPTSMINPPSHNIAHLESAYLPGYSQAPFRPVYQPAMGFGGYGPMPGVGMGGYGATGGNYEQNAPFVQNYQSGRGHSHGRQPRGGRGPRRGGRSSRDGY